MWVLLYTYWPTFIASFLCCCCFYCFFKIFLNKQPNPRKKLLVPCALDRPNTNCYVCASKPEVTVKLNVHKTIVQTLQDKVPVINFNPKALIFVWSPRDSSLDLNVFAFINGVAFSDTEGEVWHGGPRCANWGWKRNDPHLFRGRRDWRCELNQPLEGIFLHCNILWALF